MKLKVLLKKHAGRSGGKITSRHDGGRSKRFLRLIDFKRDLKDVYDAREYKTAPQIIKNLLDIKEVQKPIYKKNAFGKLVKVGERTQYVADPVKLLIARSLFTSRGFTYLDQAFGGDITGFAKGLKLTTGLKPQQIDIEVYKAIKEKEKRRALEDLLIKTGKLKEYRNVYQPK